MIFTVEIADVEKAGLGMAKVEVFLDQKGLQDLLTQLEHLKSHGDPVHFFTESWGESPLSKAKQVSTNCLVHHLQIT